MEYSKYLDEVRSPYKAAAVVREVARQPIVGLTRLEPPREEDEESNSTI